MTCCVHFSVIAMNEDIIKIIDDAKEKALKNQNIERRILKIFLELDPLSEECQYLGETARDVARKTLGNKGRVGSSIGVDLRPCTMNCKFCSLGDKWGLVKDNYDMSPEQIIAIIKNLISKGFHQFTLRTTEFYSLDALCDLSKKVRSNVDGSYILTVNTGELTTDEANRLYESGFNAAYHTVRLGEGVDTPFDPEVRINTMKAITASKLKLSCGLDPIGVEHTNDEIIDKLELFRSLNPMAICTMKRINVKGTPFENIPEISDMRHAQIAAVIRMASGGRNMVAAHPANLQALKWGANHISVETGANPRDSDSYMHSTDTFGHEDAVRMILNAGYELGVTEDFKKIAPY